METITRLLEPAYYSQFSYYGKAYTVKDIHTIKLYSYDTLVAEVREKETVIHMFYSQTTTKHIKDFLYQHGKIPKAPISKKELEKRFCK